MALVHFDMRCSTGAPVCAMLLAAQANKLLYLGVARCEVDLKVVVCMLMQTWHSSEQPKGMRR